MIGQRGYIALVSVLVLGAIAVAVALALLLSGADTQREVLAFQRSAQARNLANGCAEEALQQVHDNTAYTGNGTLLLSTGNCTYSVVNTGATTRTITATATVNSVVRNVRVYVTIGSSNVSVTSWQDVSL